MVLTPLANSYEISIFNAYPLYIWIFLFISIAIAILLILNTSKKVGVIVGVLILVYVNFVFLLLPFLRNYALYGRSDPVSHLGYMKDIILSNHISQSNFYPISHVMVVNWNFLTDLNINNLILFTPAIFYILYFVGLYLFAKEITNKTYELLLVLIFGSVLLFTCYSSLFIPNHLSFDLIPLILFLILRSKNDIKNGVSYSLLFIISLFTTTFFHPLTSLNLLVIIIIMLVAILITRNDYKTSFNFRDFINPIFLVGVSFLAWISSKTVFNTNIKRTYDWLAYDIGTPTIDNYRDSLASSNLSLTEVLSKIFLSFSHEIIYMLLSLIAMLFLIREVIFKKKFKFNYIFLILSFSVFILLSGLFLLGSLGFNNPLREYSYVLLFGIIMISIFFSKHLYNSSIEKKRIIKSFLFIIILFSSVIGFYSTYASTTTGETNIQVTNAEFVGTNWFFDNIKTYSRSAYRIYEIDRSINRFSDYYYGIDNPRKFSRGIFRPAPERGNFTNETGYLVLNEYIIQRYTTYSPDNLYYSKTDLNNLKNNKLLGRVYDNDDTQIWIVNKI